MTDCPPGDAIRRHPSGEVYIDPVKCIACGNCADNCPYDNIFMYHPEGGGETHAALTEPTDQSGAPPHSANPIEFKALAIKCDLCQGLDGGPACVRSCPTGALLRLPRPEYQNKIESVAEQKRHVVFS
jgi:Fe-S-cluster-containing hydrogenase component 2